tara:strand:+ start:58 stop:291 length:234 start_codon:yes stop_codon:yes gene_type:complete
MNKINNMEFSMKYYTVRVRIPQYIEKEIYIDDATSKTDARRKAKAWGKGEYDMCDTGADEEIGQYPSKLKVISVEEG